jgi:hypothetical protein
MDIGLAAQFAGIMRSVFSNQRMGFKGVQEFFDILLDYFAGSLKLLTYPVDYLVRRNILLQQLPDHGPDRIKAEGAAPFPVTENTTLGAYHRTNIVSDFHVGSPI